MATIVGALRVLLGLNSTQYAAGLRKASAETQAFSARSSKLSTALTGNWKRFVGTISLVGLSFRALRSAQSNIEILREHGKLEGATKAVSELSDEWNHFIQRTLLASEPFVEAFLGQILRKVEDVGRAFKGLSSIFSGPTLSAKEQTLAEHRAARQKFQDSLLTPAFEFLPPEEKRRQQNEDLVHSSEIIRLEREIEELRRKELAPTTPLLRSLEKDKGSFGGQKFIGGQEVGFLSPNFRGIGTDQVPGNISRMTELLRSIDGRLERQATVADRGGVRIVGGAFV